VEYRFILGELNAILQLQIARTFADLQTILTRRFFSIANIKKSTQSSHTLSFAMAAACDRIACVVSFRPGIQLANRLSSLHLPRNSQTSSESLCP
jgi:hypothetical protein